MKYFATFILCLLFQVQASSQVLPVYFKGDKMTTDKDEATSYALYGKLSNEDLWTFKRYDLSNNLMQTGSYSDAKLTVPHGKFIFYMDIRYFNLVNRTHFNTSGKARFIYQRGSFENGLEQGRWILFFPDGNVLNVQDYVKGVLHGEFVTYNRRGKVEVRGNYVDGMRHGEWLFDSGKKKMIYEKGILISSESVKIPKRAKNNQN